MRLATLSTWRGYTLWKCSLCDSTDTNRERMYRHLRDWHRIRIAYELPEVEAVTTEAATVAEPETNAAKPVKPAKED